MRISDWSSDVCSSDLGGEGCGDLARHVPGLAHADADHAAAAGEQQPAGAGKVAVEPGADGVQPAGLGVEDAAAAGGQRCIVRSEEHTSELQSLMRISYAVFCLKKKKHNATTDT